MKRFEVSWALLCAASLVMILFPDSAVAKATADVVQAPAQSNFSTYLGRVAVELDFSALPRFDHRDHHMQIAGIVYRNMSTGMDIPGLDVGATCSRTNKENVRDAVDSAMSHSARSLILQSMAGTLDKPLSIYPPAATAYKNPVQSHSYVIPLGYLNLGDENTKFDLNIQTTVSRKPDSTSYFSFIVPPLVACVDKFADTGLDMKQREADDYAQRRQHAQKEHVKSYMPKVAAMFLNMLEG